MKRRLAQELNKLIDQTVQIGGWISSRRDHGKIIFIDIKDRTGVTQVVFLPGVFTQDQLKNLRLYSAVVLEGIIQKRPDKLINKEIVSGEIELRAEKIIYLAQANDLPFEISSDTKPIDEALRMQYRYLDLRSDRMRQNIKQRYEIIKFIRKYMDEQGFMDIETPYLTRSTPEGSRDYLVPSRTYPGKFYALPQSPQQYKQLLMVAGFEKYYQIVRCFRDEDSRSDRLPEFTQLDIEMSFTDQEEIITIVEKLMIELVNNLYTDKKITLKPFPRLTFKESMQRYKSDRPDLREDKNNPNELAFVWVVDFPMFEYKKGDKRYGPAHHPFTAIRDEDIPKLMQKKPNLDEITAIQYDLVLNGNEIFGGSIRTTDPKILQRVFSLLQLSEEEIQQKFGHLLKAFDYGVPPHGGIAAGLDRLIAVLCNEPSIREVRPFCTLADGYDPLMNAPEEVDQKQLDELCLKNIAPKSRND